VCAVVGGALLAGLAPSTAGAKPPPACGRRVLVLTAMPLELNPLVSKATLDPRKTVRVNDRTFYVGRLAGNDVVLAMTGIGLVNAEQTATAAFEHFRCRFTAAVFSGVAGSQHNIGDVVIPKRWTRDNAKTWTPVDPAMLQVSNALKGTKVKLAQDLPTGDAACVCPGVKDPTMPVHLAKPPAVYVGGDGTSADTFGGHAVPCLPGGGDIAGCKPCITGPGFGEDVAAFARNAPALFDAEFFKAFFQPPAATTQNMDSQDEETAAVAQVARAYHVPFLGIRAASDGKGDPLNLPGFPWQFFVYRQLAGNNAATVTIAFLRLWAGH
jgi:nucleoside phosphorylase